MGRAGILAAVHPSPEGVDYRHAGQIFKFTVLASMPHEVFISYSSKDKTTADDVCATLEAASIRCWIAPRNILSGATWGEAIIDGLSTSKVMVLIFSANSNQSVQVEREVERAINKNIPVIPFRIDNVPLSKSMEYFISSAHWLVAVPYTKLCLQQLVGDVCRLLDKAAPALPALTFLDRLKILRHQCGAIVRGRALPSGLPAAAPAQPSSDRSGDDADHPLDPDVMVSQGRWYGIKLLISERESRGIPLRQLAQLQPELARRLEAFERARVHAIAALEHLGPDVVDERLRRLAEIVADHPDLEAIRRQAVVIRNEIADLRRTLDGLERQERWVAAETAIRAVAAQRGLATTSMLRAAETATVKAGKETRRLNLLLWTLLVGAAMIVTAWVVQASMGLAGNVQLTGRASDTVSPESLVGLQVVIVRLITIAAVTGIGLVAFGKRQSGTGIAFTILWALVGLTIEVLIIVLGAYSSSVPSEVTMWLPYLQGVASAIVMMNLIRVTTSEVVSPRLVFPGLAAMLATVVASAGFLPDSSTINLGSASSPMLPSSLVAAGVLAASGFLRSHTAWLALPAVALVIGQKEVNFFGAFGILFLVGSLVSGKRSLLGYVWILIVAAVASGSAWRCLHLDESLTQVPLARFTPLLSVWAVACGVVALGKKHELGDLRFFDCVAKLVATRIGYAGTKLADQRLTDTAWYKTGRSWHERRAGGSDGGEASVRSKRTPRGSAGADSPPKKL